MIRIDFSQLHQAREDAAAAMPSIAGKKILMGFWHNWPAGAADGYQQGSFANIALEDVPSEYNVVAVAFMKGAASRPSSHTTCPTRSFAARSACSTPRAARC